MSDHTTTVRALRTSELLALLSLRDSAARDRIIDPDGALATLYGSSQPTGISAARSEIDRRAAALATALTEEIDRRIPPPDQLPQGRPSKPPD